jgi:hypothetical protein
MRSLDGVERKREHAPSVEWSLCGHWWGHQRTQMRPPCGSCDRPHRLKRCADTMVTRIASSAWRAQSRVWAALACEAKRERARAGGVAHAVCSDRNRLIMKVQAQPSRRFRGRRLGSRASGRLSGKHHGAAKPLGNPSVIRSKPIASMAPICGLRANNASSWVGTIFCRFGFGAVSSPSVKTPLPRGISLTARWSPASLGTVR